MTRFFLPASCCARITSGLYNDRQQQQHVQLCIGKNQSIFHYQYYHVFFRRTRWAVKRAILATTGYSYRTAVTSRSLHQNGIRHQEWQRVDGHHELPTTT